MLQSNLHAMMDKFYDIVNVSPAQDAAEKMLRHAGTAENMVAMEALARLLVVESARRKHAEARLAARREGEEQSIHRAIQ